MPSSRWFRRALRIGMASCVWLTLDAVVDAQPRGPTVVDGVVALIGGDAPGPGVDVVLLSDVELRAQLALPAAEGLPVPASLPAALLSATLDQLIAESLIYREARRLRAPAPSPAMVLAARRRMAATVGGERALARLAAALGVDDQEIGAIATRRAMVDGYLRANLETTTAITEGAIDDAIGRVESEAPESQGALEGEPAEEYRERVRAQLARRALERGVQRFVEALRERTTVRIFRRASLRRASESGPRGSPPVTREVSRD
ncbi:MAG: hypothetical protein IT379_28270 [Deltaproteobacteria bacterium]|nr:hypothetical protein [Deltaproteobacteria bacterium]